MYTKEELLCQLKALNIDPNGTLLVHSSMKSIGEVDGGADTVLDALCEYMENGLLVFPTHTWRQINEKYNVFHAATEKSCVGLLTNLFMEREGVPRSLHPTHSVAARGKDAAEYVSGEENARTPCPRSGCWGKLYDRKATILFIGCSMKHNTFLHGVEEWNEIPNRLAAEPQDFYTVAPDGTKYHIPQYRHRTNDPNLEPSEQYDKMEPIFVKEGATWYGKFGDAHCAVCDAVKMADITTAYLKEDVCLFDTMEWKEGK